MHPCCFVYSAYKLPASNDKNPAPSRLVRIRIDDADWSDFKLAHQGERLTLVLGELVKRDVNRARRTNLTLTPERVEKSIEDARAIKDEIAELVEQLEVLQQWLADSTT